MDAKEIKEMNVIPLVDIMLVLLTIVLTTATFIVTGEIAVNLPEAKTSEGKFHEPLYITITAEEKIYFNNKLVMLDELSSVFDDFEKSTGVVIRADEKVSIKIFVSVIDNLKEAGFKRISMEVKKS